MPDRRVISVLLARIEKSKAGREKAPRDGAGLLGRESEGLGGIGSLPRPLRLPTRHSALGSQAKQLRSLPMFAASGAACRA